MYKPSEDTFLLEDCIKGIKGYNALDICTGSGYIAYTLSKNFKNVVAIDIDINTLLDAKKSDNISYICSNSASCLNTKFDLITINPPYLPSYDIDDITVDGGREGVEVTLKILESCKRLMHRDSKIFIVCSSLSNIDKILKLDGFNAKIVKSKRIWFEDIVIIRAMLK
ncbi:MAG: protoporphyrinogen oxidase [Candidatus Nitrosocaldaceae archaeon]|nr:MAG: protoporphyrinogen oxidase [Candidatus Nitrosocaldaceae archaeon]